MMSYTKKQITYFRLLVGLLLLSVLTYSVGGRELSSVLIGVQPLPVFGAVCCLWILFFIGGLNIWILLNALKSIDFKVFLKLYAYSWPMSLLVPGQAGDAVIIVLLKKNNIPLHVSSSAYFVDKVITLAFFLFIALCGGVIFTGKLDTDFNNSFIYLMLICLLAIVLCFYCVGKNEWLRKKIGDFTCGVLINIRALKKKPNVIMLNIGITVAKWLIVSTAFFLTFQGLGTTVPFRLVAVIPIISTLVGYIPVSIAGLGTVELTAVVFFGLLDVNNSVVLGVYLLMRVIQYSIACCLLIICQLSEFR